MSLPLDAADVLRKDPGATSKMISTHGGSIQTGRDGSVHASVGDRPIPPPKAMRWMHAIRQEEKQQRADDEEAEEFMAQHGMEVKKDIFKLNSEDDACPEMPEDQARALRQVLAERDLEGSLAETAFQYDIYGAGLMECNGLYEYTSATCHGGPVYQNAQGWTLHRDRPPVVSTVGTDNVSTDFGWLISKGGRPFYAVRTESLRVPASGWQCFMGPEPAPDRVTSLSWEDHLLDTTLPLKDDGNRALQQGLLQLAEEHYSAALGHFVGLDSILEASEKLKKQHIALFANRAEARLRLKKWELAAEDCRKVLAMDPSHLKAAHRLFRGSRMLGRTSEALPLLEAVKEASDLAGARAVSGLLIECKFWAGCERGTSPWSDLLKAVLRFARIALRPTLPGDLKQRKRLRKAAEEILQRTQIGAQHKQSKEPSCAEVLEFLKLIPMLTRVAAGEVSQDLFEHLPQLDERSDNKTNDDDDGRCSTDSDEDLSDDTDDNEDEDGGTSSNASWVVKLLASLVVFSPGEVMEALPALAGSLSEAVGATSKLVRNLLEHPDSRRRKFADRLLQLPGLWPKCLKQWVRLLGEGATHSAKVRVCEAADDAAECILLLSAQVAKLDNKEALALALFVEAFVGQKRTNSSGAEVVSGGLSLLYGETVAKVVLGLLKHWAVDKEVLQSLSTALISRAWLPITTKLRRDASVDVVKDLPGPRKLCLQWFKLQTARTLRPGVFQPEELLEAFLAFLLAHLEANSSESSPGPCEQDLLEEGHFAPPNMAETWVNDILDKPFGWGVLLPLVLAPPSIASRALGLLATIVDRFPQQEQLGAKLAKLHLFLPLLNQPWPVNIERPATSWLEETLQSGAGNAGADAAGAIAKVLRCCLDSEIAFRVLSDLESTTSGRSLASECLTFIMLLIRKQAENPYESQRSESLVAGTEALGLLASNLECWQLLGHEDVEFLVKSLQRSLSSAVRMAFAKVLRHLHREDSTRQTLQSVIEGKALQLSSEQQSLLLREILDLRTTAGRAEVEARMKMQMEAEQVSAPVDIQALAEADRKPWNSFADELLRSYLLGKEHPKVLVFGRKGAFLAKILAEKAPFKGGSGSIILAENPSAESLEATCVTSMTLPVSSSKVEDLLQQHLASEVLLDLAIFAEPTRYGGNATGDMAAALSAGLRSRLRRREKEDERKKDQVQLVCLELKDRLEDARDELYAAEYYDADHDASLQKLKGHLARLNYGVALFGLQSEERENEKRRREARASEARRERLTAELRRKEEEEKEDEKRKELLSSVFSTRNEDTEGPSTEVMLVEVFGPDAEKSTSPFFSSGGSSSSSSPPQSQPHPLAADVSASSAAPPAPTAPGASKIETILFYLPSEEELRSNQHLGYLPSLVQQAASKGERHRCVLVYPGGAACTKEQSASSAWFLSSASEVMALGTRWFEMARGVMQADDEAAAKDPIKNVAFSRPTLEELKVLEGLEPSVRAVAKALEVTLVNLPESCNVILAGSGQGGAVLAYLLFAGVTSPEVLRRISSAILVQACVPVLHFLGSRMQATCLKARESAAAAATEKTWNFDIILAFETASTIIPESYVTTSWDFYKRFGLRPRLLRYSLPTEGSEEQTPALEEECMASKRDLLLKAMSAS